MEDMDLKQYIRFELIKLHLQMPNIQNKILNIKPIEDMVDYILQGKGIVDNQYNLDKFTPCEQILLTALKKMEQHHG